MASSGSAMDHYTVLKEIGQGATGQALLVEDNRDTSKRYVVKKMNLKQLSKKEQQNAAMEVQVMQRLLHPFIIKYETSFEENHTLGIIMEYAGGGDLQKLIERQGNVHFPEDLVLDWFTQLSLALKHCHDQNILHRDLKTENIFLDHENRVKLGDFGLGKCLNSSLDMAKTTAGTPFYLSPEITRGKEYNAKSDIWALGCVLYKMLTFQHAFQTNSLQDLILKIQAGKPVVPIPRMYSAAVRALVDFLFDTDPQTRPSITEVILGVPAVADRVEQFLPKEMVKKEFGFSKIRAAIPALSSQDGAFSEDSDNHYRVRKRKTKDKSKANAKKAAGSGNGAAKRPRKGQVFSPSGSGSGHEYTDSGSGHTSGEGEDIEVGSEPEVSESISTTEDEEEEKSGYEEEVAAPKKSGRSPVHSGKSSKKATPKSKEAGFTMTTTSAEKNGGRRLSKGSPSHRAKDSPGNKSAPRTSGSRGREKSSDGSYDE